MHIKWLTVMHKKRNNNIKKMESKKKKQSINLQSPLLSSPGHNVVFLKTVTIFANVFKIYVKDPGLTQISISLTGIHTHTRWFT